MSCLHSRTHHIASRHRHRRISIVGPVVDHNTRPQLGYSNRRGVRSDRRLRSKVTGLQRGAVEDQPGSSSRACPPAFSIDSMYRLAFRRPAEVTAMTAIVPVLYRKPASDG